MHYMKKENRPYALIMKKGTVARHELERNPLPVKNNRACQRNVMAAENSNLPTRQQALRRIIEHSPIETSVVIATTGFCGRELFAEADRPNHLYMVGSMGCASSLALGLSIARPDLNVFVIDGDGAALMRMGNLATLGTYATSNLLHILLDNEVHDSTGAQATVSGHVKFADIAAACAYGVSYSGNTVEMIDELVQDTDSNGPRFAHLKISAGTIDELPRPNITPEDVLRRLMAQIGTSF